MVQEKNDKTFKQYFSRGGWLVKSMYAKLDTQTPLAMALSDHWHSALLGGMDDKYNGVNLA